MKLLIIHKGVPHPESEDANQKIYLLIQALYKKYDVDLALIDLPDVYKNYKSIDTQNRDERDFNNEFKKINIEKIPTTWSENNFSFSYLLKKFIKIFSFNFRQFYANFALEKKLLEILNTKKPDVVLTWCDSEVLSNLIKCSSKKKFKIIQFVGLMDHETQKIRMENEVRRNNNFFLKSYIILRYKYLIFKTKFFFVNLSNKASLNIFFDTDSVVRAKKIGIKNVEYSKQYVRDFGGDDWLSKKQKSEDILFLNAALTTTNINAVDKLIKYIIPHLQELKNKNNKIFNNLVVVGVENELTKKIKDLNISWIVFTGWIDKISSIYLKSKCMIIPNNSFLGSRTKVFHALSCGLPVITHECNIRFHLNLVNKKNILKANDYEHMKTLITEFLSGDIDANNLSLNARIAFEEGYKKDAILDLLINKIENIR